MSHNFCMDWCYRPVATIVYIAFVILDSIKMFLLKLNQYARSNERSRNAYFMSQNVIFLYGLLQLPLLLVFMSYQISEVLFDMHK